MATRAEIIRAHLGYKCGKPVPMCVTIKLLAQAKYLTLDDLPNVSREYPE